MQTENSNSIKIKILITGGSGFLGGYLVKEAAKQFDVTATFYQNCPKYDGCYWQLLDLSDIDQIEKCLTSLQPKMILHNAAITNVDKSEKNKTQTLKINTHASKKIAQIAHEMGTRVIYISTDLVFDGAEAPYREDSTPAPLSHYGWSKWQGELATKENSSDFCIIRPSIIFGPPAISGSSFSEWMIQSWYKNKVTKLFSDQFRTPVYAGNLAAAIIEAAKNGFIGILHIAGSESIDRYRFGLLLAQHLCTNTNNIEKSKMQDVQLTGKRPADVSLDITLAKKILNTRLYNCYEGIPKAYPGRQF
jgi:dTDP-4-dehydrorhamnose reductase